MTEYRIEHDTMGEVKVPADALWRAQTQRAVQNFPISGRGLESAQIRAMGLLKAACAQVNKDSGDLPAEQADAIIAAAKEIAEGKQDAEFPIDVFQTGSGTSSNMNTNEVIASIAKNNGVEVHPNDHVNMGQSSNDTFPTATHVASTEAAVKDLIPGLKVLQESLEKKAKDWEEVVKSGRTHLMDAVPVTLGQEFSGYARQIAAGIERVEATLPRLGELPIGGTAVGTGLNTPADFGEKVTAELVKLTGVEELRECVESRRAAGGLPVVRRELEMVLSAVAGCDGGQEPDEAELAVLALAISVPAIRDALLALMTGDAAAGAERLWMLMARRLPDAGRAEAAALCAVSAYARGDGPFAGICLEAAMAANPEHRLAHLLREALDQGMHPDRIRKLAEVGRDCAADLGVILPG